MEIDRYPQKALQIIDATHRMTDRLHDEECRPLLGDVWKQRANAFRHLARYDESLDAAAIAEAFYASLPAGEFDIAQAQYTQAATLFKMTRLTEAQQVLDRVIASLEPYGANLPLAKAKMLYASLKIEQGDVSTAEMLWLATLPLLRSLGSDVEEARVLANLAECHLRLGDLNSAMNEARQAVDRYRRLGMDGESIRSEWTVGMIHLASGESEDGMDVLVNVAAAFDARGMLGDAAFAKLDICEESLRRKEWADAEVTARELTALFTSLNVTVANATAVDYLRRAVQNREATDATVRYIREYIMADDAGRPFAPPGTA